MSDFELRPFARGIGAEVFGLDVSRPLSRRDEQSLQDAFLQHHVLALHDQRLEPRAQLAFARSFGVPEQHAIVEGMPGLPEVIRVHKPAGAAAGFGVGWHTDNSFQEAPTGATVLYGEVIPPQGGDTLFADMERAFEALPAEEQQALSSLKAVHGASRAYDPERVGREKYEGRGPLRYRYSEAVHTRTLHPLVRTHPDTGRRALFVNPMFTLFVEGLDEAESERLLARLFEHGARPEFQCRLRWRPGMLAIWDNRCVWHNAMDDYRDHERLMYRVTLAGERPF